MFECPVNFSVHNILPCIVKPANMQLFMRQREIVGPAHWSMDCFLYLLPSQSWCCTSSSHDSELYQH